MPEADPLWQVVIVGAGPAGLSAAVYLARAQRRVLLVDGGHSMALWEPEVQNYLGFPEGIAGGELLARGRAQAEKYGAARVSDSIRAISGSRGGFLLQGERAAYRAQRVLLATGIFHVPPAVPGLRECIGRSLFFCKDCDGVRVAGHAIAIVGANEDAAEYALGMLSYSPRVLIATDGEAPRWSERHAAWLAHHEIPVHRERLARVEHVDRRLMALHLAGGRRLAVEYVFSTLGERYHTALALALGAAHDEEGQLVVDARLETSVPGLFAAGCVTPANCQMIIAAGQGATAAQAISRDLFEESLADGSLARLREGQRWLFADWPEHLTEWNPPCETSRSP